MAWNVKNEMPIGSTICSTGVLTEMPRLFNRSVIVVTKKLKYLKYPRMPRLATTAMRTSQMLAGVRSPSGVSARCTSRPNNQLRPMLSSSRYSKPQSHQP